MEPVYWLAIAFVLAGAILVALVVRYFYRAARGTRVKGVVHKTTGRVSHGGPRRDRRVHYTAYIEYQFNDCEYLMELPLGTGVFPYYPAGSKLTVVVDEEITTFKVYPVEDIEAFSKKIKFGKPSKVDTDSRSITVELETLVQRQLGDEEIKVTGGRFKFVAIDEEGRPRPVPQE